MSIYQNLYNSVLWIHKQQAKGGYEFTKLAPPAGRLEITRF